MQITTDSIREQIPYYLSQEAKENLVKALDNFPRKIEYYINKYPNEVLQGDGWDSVDIINFEDANRKLIKAVLLSNSCDVSTENKRDLPIKLTFAPIIKLNSYQNLLIKANLGKQQIEEKINAIKEQKITSLIYLPKGSNLEDDYIALLDDLHTVPYQTFNSHNDKKKLFTLSQVGFYLFNLKLSVHFCRFHEEVQRGAD
jgi:hypothetical protein